jgi:hypothetical protein
MANALRLSHGVIIVSGNVNESRTEPRDGLYTFTINVVMYEDAGLAADKIGARRNRATVIAIRGATKRHLRDEGTNLGGQQLRRSHIALEQPACFFERKTDDGIGSSKRFETSEAKTAALILDVNRLNAERFRDVDQHAKRGRAMDRKQLQHLCDPGGSLRSQRLLIDGSESFAIVRVPVGFNHVKLASGHKFISPEKHFVRYYLIIMQYLCVKGRLDENT